MDYNTDQFFREKLKNYQIQPPEGVWSAIVSKKRASDLKRKALLLLLLLLLLLGLLLFILPRGEMDETAPHIAGTETQTGQQEFPLESPLTVAGEEFIAETLTEEKILEEESPLTVSGEKFIGETPTEEKLFEEESQQLADDFPSKPTTDAAERNFSTTIERVSSNSDSPEIPAELSTSRVGETEEFSVDDRSDESLRSSGSFAIPEPELALHHPIGTSHLEENPAQLRSTEEGRSAEAGESVFYSESVSILEGRSTFSELLSKRSTQSLDYNRCAIKNNPICLETQFPLRYFALDILAGPDFFDKLLQAKDSEFDEFAEMRRSSESEIWSYGVSARLSAVFESGLALRTGLSFNQINEKFTFEDPDAEVRRVVNVLIDTLINAPMDTTFIFDTLSVIESGTRLKEVYNRYQMLDIPVMVGAEFQSGNWTLTPSLGVMFNLAFRTRGEIMDQSGSPTPIDNTKDSETPIFRTRLGMSLTGSFGVGYKLSSEYSLMIEPRIKYHLKPLTVSGYPLNQNYFVFGVHAGLRYRFK